MIALLLVQDHRVLLGVVVQPLVQVVQLQEEQETHLLQVHLKETMALLEHQVLTGEPVVAVELGQLVELELRVVQEEPGE